MKPTRKGHRVLAMAVAGVLAVGVPVGAQIATGDGRANDANIRVGSGGFNSLRPPNQGVTPNQIIYGNVTAGQQFRGPVLERDPMAFTGPTAGFSTDRFIATSAAAPTPYQPAFNLSSPTPFYGASRGVAPPPDTARVGYTGAFVGGGTMRSDFSNMDQFRLAGVWQAQPLGVSIPIGTRTTILGTRPEELWQEIPEGAENQQLHVSGSPLFGIQSLPNSQITNPLDQYLLPSTLMPGVSSDRFRAGQPDILRMRRELQENQQPAGEGQQQQGSAQPLNAQDRGQTPLTANARFPNGLENPQDQDRRLNTLVPPEMQSTQYAELQRRLAGQHNDQFAQLQAVHEMNQSRRAAAARAAAASQPSQTVTTPPPGMIRQGGAAGMLNLPPLKVNSLATGVRAKGLHDLLSSAEDLMRQGKFQSAIDRYNMAQQVAPNNPLISVGRANAELGAGAYRQAADDLRSLFVNDPSTLMAQYNLAAWFPPDRLSAIQRELSDLSSKDTKDETPEFLLAYLAYNAGDSQAAAQHLAEANKRSGGKDPALQLMQTDWKLNKAETPQTPSDLNK
jgi:hypothetical protein